MSKRIQDIADELGVSAKMIVDKCLQEGIPPDKVRGPSSTVTVGLEATIREWIAHEPPPPPFPPPTPSRRR